MLLEFGMFNSNDGKLGCFCCVKIRGMYGSVFWCVLFLYKPSFKAIERQNSVSPIAFEVKVCSLERDRKRSCCATASSSKCHRLTYQSDKSKIANPSPTQSIQAVKQNKNGITMLHSITNKDIHIQIIHIRHVNYIISIDSWYYNVPVYHHDYWQYIIIIIYSITVNPQDFGHHLSSIISPNLLVLQPLHLHLMIWCNKKRQSQHDLGGTWIL